MKTKNKWITVLIISVFLLVGYSVLAITRIRAGVNFQNTIKGSISGTSEEIKLPIPSILEDLNPADNIADFRLNVQKSSKEFIKGKSSETYGYNGDFLGPVIKVKRGDQVNVSVSNSLDEATTLHWHGLELPGRVDGNVQQSFMPSETYNATFVIDQPAATLWYHPHLLHKTGEQVYKGLAGLFLIEDDVSNNLDIPKKYGENDIPIVVQDRRFASDGSLVYANSMADMMNGMIGDVVLINGAINPTLDVKTEKIRLRLLNGSNARVYKFSFSDNNKFYQIATDGGFLEAPVEMNELILAPAERVEIIVDFSKYKVGDKITLKSNNANLMNFKVTESSNDTSILPKQLTKISKIPTESATVTRTFSFQGMGRGVNINGKQMNMDRIDERVKYGATEIWQIRNDTMHMMHPFHAHGVQFLILERNGKKPPANEQGFKDTIAVAPGETVKAITTFRYKGIFMYHCHILEHEDLGMMGQFLVE
ncbi:MULTISPECIES: multicopper oxidase family protein [Clostridium]|uniref:multicopper oxidase family protein n=1 Tax=Clostridium TaxID=1485 RepID=UPI00073DA23B|nr:MULTISPECIES: multicopper oxidase domain-containing protein [Clostridium]UZQ48935.1 multicopper oxidase domain-containing protein [Clostridium kluyveri]